MRLITRKIYRAFPELDKFSDEQCERFLHAANASIVRRMCRGAVSFGFAIVVGLLALVGAVYAAQELADHWRLDGFLYWLLFGVLTTTALVIAFIPGLILADGLLRLRVRSLLKRCGTCPQCSYSLLGIRVGADLIVTCPECGRQVEVDPAFDELATDETGARVYRPQAFRLDAETIARRRRRRRWILKWSAIGVGSVVVLLVSGYGVFWGFLSWQAWNARSARNTMALIESHRIGAGPDARGVDQHKEWETFLEITSLVSKLELEANESGLYKTDAGEDVYFDFGVIRQGVIPEVYDKASYPAGAYLAARRRVLDALAKTEADGTQKRLREIPTLHAPLRRFVDMGNVPFFEANELTGLGSPRAMARLNAARMIEAVNAGNRDEYLEALEELLAAARIVESQQLLIYRQLANAIRTLAISRVLDDMQHYPDPYWFDEVGAILLEYESRTPLAVTLDLERIIGLDYVHWYFAESGRVHNVYLGIGDTENPNEDLLFLGVGNLTASGLGTHRANVQAMERLFEPLIAEAGKPMADWNVPAMPTTGLFFVDLMTSGLGRSFKTEAQGAYDYRTCMFSLGVERFRREHKRLPRQTELAAIGLPAEFLLDPLNGKPFGVRERFGPMRDELPFVIYGGGEAPEEPDTAE